MTSQGSAAKYKCPICKDTGWVQGENGYRRCNCQEKEILERLWKSFGVNPDEVKKVSEYKVYDETTKLARNKAMEYIKSFNSIRTLRENSFGLFGQPGAGKSHLVIAMGAALLNKNIQVVYMPYLEVMRQLEANKYSDEEYMKISSRYNTAKVLIIDDLFKDKLKNGQLIKNRYGYPVGLNGNDIKNIMPIINYRYFNKLPMLISTECTPIDLRDLDDAMGSRLLEACGNNITVFKGQQYNYRMRKFIKKGDKND